MPITDLLKEQAAFSLDSVESWFRNCMEQGEFVDDEYEKVYKWNAWIPKDVLYRLYKKEMSGGYQKLKEPNKFWPAVKKLSDYDEQRVNSKRQAKFRVSLEESVIEWNAKRGDNVEVQKINVIIKEKDEVNTSDLDA